MTLNPDFSRILDKFGRSQDSLYYWALYKNTPRNQFAVIKISGECLEDSLDKLAEDISDMYALGLIPVVTHGWGKSLNARLENAGISNNFVDGERYTDRKVMGYVEEIAQENLDKLFNALSKRNVDVRALRAKDRVVIAEDKNDDRYGRHNGNIVAVNTKPIFSAIESGKIPLISPIGISRSGRKHYNLNSASVGAEIAKAIDPVKYIMVTGIGGVFNNETIVPELVLRRDYQQMVESGDLSGGMKKNVDEANQCLISRETGVDRSVQIVGPGHLLKELFSRRGDGTYVRLGYDITPEPMEMLDRSKIRGLVEKVFGARLKDSFFTEAQKQVHVESSYKGLAVVIENPITSDNPEVDLIDYMDILAVDCEYKGNGLGSDLVHSILTTQPLKEMHGASESGRRNGHTKTKVFWRSKQSREDATNWYYHLADGHWAYIGADKEAYNLFWIGLTKDEVCKALAYVRNRQPNFEPKTA